MAPRFETFDFETLHEVVGFGRTPSDMEAIMAAWVLSDPGMLRAHDSVNRYRDVGTSSDGMATIGMDPPRPAFAGAWTFEGAWIDCEEEEPSTFLVTRIRDPAHAFLREAHDHASPSRGAGRRPSDAFEDAVPRPKPIPRMQERTPSGSGQASVELPMDGALLEPAHAIDIVRFVGPAGGPPPPLVLIGEVGRSGDLVRLRRTFDRRQEARRRRLARYRPTA